MAIRVSCQCGKAFKVSDESAGKRYKCPACGNPIQVPTDGADTAAALGIPPSDAPAAAPPSAYVAPYGAAAKPGAPKPPPMPTTSGERGMSPAQQPVQSLQYASSGSSAGGPIAPPPTIHVTLPTLLPAKLMQPGLTPCHLVFDTHGTEINTDFDVAPVLQSFAEGFAGKLKKRFDVQLTPPPAGAAVAFVRVIQLDQGNRWVRYLFGIFFGGTRFEIDGHIASATGLARPFKFKHRGRAGLFGGSSLRLLKTGGKYLGKKVGKCVLKA